MKTLLIITSTVGLCACAILSVKGFQGQLGTMAQGIGWVVAGMWNAINLVEHTIGK